MHPTNEKIKDNLVESKLDFPCPECGAPTFGKNKSFCTRCDWSCDHKPEDYTLNDEINGVEHYSRCSKCKKELI